MRKDHPIVNNQDFENGIVKIQKGETLTPSEEEAVKMFKKKTVVRPVTELTYAEQCKQRGKLQRTSEYIETSHIIGDSNICERAFSRARHFMHYLRAHMAPESLELLLLFLYCNSDLWEYPAIIDEAMSSWENKEQQEAEAAAAAAAEVEGDEEEEDDPFALGKHCFFRAPFLIWWVENFLYGEKTKNPKKWKKSPRRNLRNPGT